MATINLKPPASPGERAYYGWHGRASDALTWGDLSEAGRARWEAVGAAVCAADQDSRRILVARLENMQKSGDHWLTIPAILALINDCDMLATVAQHQPGEAK